MAKHNSRVEYIERTELLFFGGSSAINTHVGAIRYVTAWEVPRIHNQAAFFLEVPHPEIHRQLVHGKYYFWQRNDTVFEDDTLKFPVTRDRIYPQNDAFAAKLLQGSYDSISEPLSWEPPLQSLKQLDATIFLHIAQNICGGKIRRKTLIARFCSLHAVITLRYLQLPLYIVTLTVRSFFSGFRKFQCVEFWSLMRSHRFMGKLTADLSPRYQATEGSAIKLQHHSLSGD